MEDSRSENPKAVRQNALTFVLVVIYLLALTWLILFKLQFSIPVLDEGRIINLIPLLGSFDDNGVILFSEITNNILAFIPLGIYICMLKAPWSFVKKVLAVAVVTLAFETTQFIFAIGRADITDLLSNTLGGVVGIGIYALSFKLMKGKTNKLMNALAASLTAFALLSVALLLANNRWIRIR